nr:hypothetical protein [Fortiea contorta]
MSSSEGKFTNTAAMGQPTSAPTPEQKDLLSDRHQIYSLIDSLLSFEACLYHQILPLKLGDNKLLLGMVSPQESEALDYANRILSSIHCTMVVEPIAADLHHTILSAYLNHKNTSPSQAKPAQQLTEELSHNSTTVTKNNWEIITNHQEILPNSYSQAENLSETTTLISTFSKNKEAKTEPAQLRQNSTALSVQIPEILSPIELLPKLPPKRLLEELLGRVLAGGIGRLYLERQPYQGKILWSDNGVLQSVIENLPLSVLQGVLNELKRFAGLPITTITEPKQIEKECLHQQKRLLLRLRVMPGIYGEEATLQVLRGAALKFYQQQQLGHVSRDTLSIAQQLNLKLHELQQRLVVNSSLQSDQLNALLTLNKLMANIDQQIKTMAAINQPDDTIK